MNSYHKIFQKRFSSSAKEGISSKIVRQRFIDFFQENNHKFVRSSSVVPRNDPTIPFINAGMCQFKHFLSGELEPPFQRVVNSQKCIRVSGKHNDLNEVGLDGHHHTFFEMLGNWSFNDYFKETACRLAWDLLTTPPFSLNKKKLYVTYFSGAPSLSLPPDMETHDIWRKIGVPEDHIFAAGLTDNFWEMSRIGPCGPCTEILMDRSEQERKVDNFSQLTELWNIVFIQYNREDDGSLKLLPKSHVDTGMGLERILAVLLNKSSNYDTDLFLPLFETIHKVSGVRAYKGKFDKEVKDGLDTAYRKLADHCRMATVALADGVFPDTSPKLKRILRRALTIPGKYFGLENGEDLVAELSQRVAESLGTAYPEIQTNSQQVLTLIRDEAELLRSLQKTSNAEWNRLLAIHPELSAVDVQSMLGITAAYKDTKKQMEKRKIEKGNYLPADLVVRLFDTFGLDLEAATDLGTVLGFKIDVNDFNEEFGEFKGRSKEHTVTTLKSSKLLSDDILQNLLKSYPKTDDSYKYNYHRDEQKKYKFNNLSSKLLAVIKNDNVIFSANEFKENTTSIPKSDLTNIKDGEELSFIFDKTCFYSEAGGQESDLGYILIESSDQLQARINVKSVKSYNGYVIHRGRVKLESEGSEFAISSPCTATLVIDECHRLRNMQNHTAVHILNAVLGKPNRVVAQRASEVCSSSLRFDFNLYGAKLGTTGITPIENEFRQVIQKGLPVERRVVSGDQIFSQDVKLLPGEIYPFEKISTIEIKDDKFFSKEACCGTHVLNTKDIEDFIITKYNASSRINSIIGVTGEVASTARAKADRISLKIKNFKANTKNTTTGSSTRDRLKEHEDFLKDLESELRTGLLPVDTCNSVREFIELILSRKIKQLLRELCVDEVVAEIESTHPKTDDKFMVHCISKSQPLNKNVLSEVIEKIFFHDRPVLICGYTGDSVIAMCKVPKDFSSKDFNAKEWITAAAEPLTNLPGKVSIKADKGHGPDDTGIEEKFHFERIVEHLKREETAKLIAESAMLKAQSMFVK